MSWVRFEIVFNLMKDIWFVLVSFGLNLCSTTTLTDI